jgi:Holliday junction DNA helicase RuvA
MISHLSGKLIHTDGRYLVIDVHGVGYKVGVSAETHEKVKLNPEHVSLWTHLVVREDALDLYGFVTQEELEFFEMLIGISGIGPKSALSILNLATISTIKKAISTGDSTYLTKVSGIGKKNAEKIVLELKDKLVVMFDEAETGNAQSHSDSLEALKALGYGEREAREALKKVPKELTDTGECVKFALKILSKS